MASRKQSAPKNLPRANPETEQEAEEDQRTEITSEYRGAKINVRIGRGASMLLWGITWAIIVLSTMIGLLMLGSFLEKMGGLLGCTISTAVYLTSWCSAYWLRS